MSTDLNYSATRDPFSALGLDVGNRRIGVAGSDGLGLLATGLGVIRRRSLPEDIAQVQEWIRRRRATVVVVGIPLWQMARWDPRPARCSGLCALCRWRWIFPLLPSTNT